MNVSHEARRRGGRAHTRPHAAPRLGRRRAGNVSFFLAGDTSYNQSLLLAGKVDGVSPDPRVTQETHARILSLAAERPLVLFALPRPGLGATTHPMRGDRRARGAPNHRFRLTDLSAFDYVG